MDTRGRRDAPQECSKKAEYVCADTNTVEGGVNGTGRVDLITCLPSSSTSSSSGGRAVQAEAHWGRADGQTSRRAVEQTTKHVELNGDKLQARHVPERGGRGGLGAWHCHNLSDRRDLEHLGRRGGRRVETRRHGWPGSTTGSQGFQLQRFEAHPGVRGRCEARKIAPDWPDWPRLSQGWGTEPVAPASVVGVRVRTRPPYNRYFVVKVDS